MKPQNYRVLDQVVVRAFLAVRKNFTASTPRLRLSWSNWSFGTEPLHVSLARLRRYGVGYIELHGNLYGPDLGYKARDVVAALEANDIRVSGVCAMLGPDQCVSSDRPHVRQRAIDYLRRQADFCKDVGGSYLLFGAGAVGLPATRDERELGRAAETIRVVGEYFAEVGVRGTIEPIRQEEVTQIHTLADCVRLLDLIDHPGVKHISGDAYHMLSGEQHVGKAILEYGSRMNNLGLADTNRRGLGQGLLDVDIIEMALYAVGYNVGENYATAEPLAAGASAYSSLHGEPEPAVMDDLVSITASTFHQREAEILNVSDEELCRAYDL